MLWECVTLCHTWFSLSLVTQCDHNSVWVSVRKREENIYNLAQQHLFIHTHTWPAVTVTQTILQTILTSVIINNVLQEQGSRSQPGSRWHQLLSEETPGSWSPWSWSSPAPVSTISRWQQGMWSVWWHHFWSWSLLGSKVMKTCLLLFYCVIISEQEFNFESFQSWEWEQEAVICRTSYAFAPNRPKK